MTPLQAQNLLYGQFSMVTFLGYWLSSVHGMVIILKMMTAPGMEPFLRMQPSYRRCCPRDGDNPRDYELNTLGMVNILGLVTLASNS